MGTQINMPGELKKYLSTQLINSTIDRYKIKKVLGIGNTAVTYEAEDIYGIRWAFKLVTVETYEGKSPIREVERFAEIQDDRYLVFPKECNSQIIHFEGKDYHFYSFVSKLIEGETLKHFLTTEQVFSAKDEIYQFIKNISTGLDLLHRYGFEHGDLHSGNIMRTTIGKDGLDPETRYVIIDFGEAHQIENPQEGINNDLELFGEHIQKFYDVIYQRETTPSEDDEKTLHAIGKLPGLLKGISSQTRIITAKEIFQIFIENRKQQFEGRNRLSSPFDLLSAEYITDDSLLADLCLTNLPWISDLKKHGNVVLFGPRGCGKTMIFRRLRLRTKILSNKKTINTEILEDPYVGFYIPIESYYFLRYSDITDELIEENKGAFITYFNMVILQEIAATLALSKDKKVFQNAGDLHVDLLQLLRNELDILWQELKITDTVIDFSGIEEIANSVIRYIRKKISYNEKINVKGAPEFVQQIVKEIKNKIPEFSNKIFIFFLDDYTKERISTKLQDIYEPITSPRNPDFCFKISAHMYGSIYNFAKNIVLDEGRNYQSINLGSIYMNSGKKKEDKQLILEIIDERFKHSDGYKGDIKDWLGHREYPNNITMGEMLRDSKLRKQPIYFGIETIIDLCSGDFSEIIKLVGRIFQEANIEANTPCVLIKPKKQEKAIRRFSQENLSRIRYIRNTGNLLYDITKHFGMISRSYLYFHDYIKKGYKSDGTPRNGPYQVLNIYIQDLSKILDPQIIENWRTLQEASIFVDIGVAASRRGPISDRATMRRIYCPAFKTTLHHGENFTLSSKDFEFFMTTPHEFSLSYLIKNINNFSQEKFRSDDLLDIEVAKENLINIFDENTQKKYGDLISDEHRNKILSLSTPFPLNENKQISDTNFDIFIGGIGFEERTTLGITQLIENNYHVKKVVLFEYDKFYDENIKSVDLFTDLSKKITGGDSFIRFKAKISKFTSNFPNDLRDLILSLGTNKIPRIIFDITSCPSIILSQTIKVLFDIDCELTILYSEPQQYYPTEEEWEKNKALNEYRKTKVEFIENHIILKPPILQSDDTSEKPSLLIVFPTINLERTKSVINNLDPTKIIWLLGKPNNGSRNYLSIIEKDSWKNEIDKFDDQWCEVEKFGLVDSLKVISGIYLENHDKYKLLIMPHGSKMQTISSILTSIIYPISIVFATPEIYDPKKYSSGSGQSWVIIFGKTQEMKKDLLSLRKFTY